MLPRQIITKQRSGLVREGDGHFSDSHADSEQTSTNADAKSFASCSAHGHAFEMASNPSVPSPIVSHY